MCSATSAMTRNAQCCAEGPWRDDFPDWTVANDSIVVGLVFFHGVRDYLAAVLSGVADLPIRRLADLTLLPLCGAPGIHKVTPDVASAKGGATTTVTCPPLREEAAFRRRSSDDLRMGLDSLSVPKTGHSNSNDREKCSASLDDGFWHRAKSACIPR
jgi:hypothetical protein